MSIEGWSFGASASLWNFAPPVTLDDGNQSALCFSKSCASGEIFVHPFIRSLVYLLVRSFIHPPSASEAPTQASEALTLASKTLTQASEAPTQSSNAPTQSSQAPTQASEALTQASEALTQASETPIQASNAPLRPPMHYSDL